MRLLPLALIGALASVGYMLPFSILVLVAQERLGVDGFGYGVILSVSALGGLLGASMTARVRGRISYRWTIVGSLLTGAGSLLALSTTTSPPVAAVLLAVYILHAVVWGIAADAGRLAEGAIVADGAGDAATRDVGRNSFLREGWLPPDPPTGHGAHRYCFQLFALDGAAVDPGASPGRAALIEAMQGHVVAAGVLVGTYGRGEEAEVGPIGAAMPAA